MYTVIYLTSSVFDGHLGQYYSLDNNLCFNKSERLTEIGAQMGSTISLTVEVKWSKLSE